MFSSEFIFNTDGEPTFSPASYARRSQRCNYGTEWVIAAIGLAVSIASAGVGLYMQSQQASAQEDYQEQLASRQGQVIQQNYALADESAKTQTKAVDLQVEQADANAAQGQFINAIDAAKARATARTAAAESGVEGPSLHALMDDFYRQEAHYRHASDENLRYTHIQSSLDKQGIMSQRAGRIASQQPYIPTPIQQPNYFGAALGIGGAGLKAYDRIYGKQPPVSPSGTSQSYAGLGADYYSAGGGNYM